MSKTQRVIKGAMMLGGVWIAGHWFASNWSGAMLADKAMVACVAALDVQPVAPNAAGLSAFAVKRKEIATRYETLWRNSKKERQSWQAVIIDGLPVVNTQRLYETRTKLNALIGARDSEFLALEKHHPPTMAEQAAIYEARRQGVMDEFARIPTDDFYSVASKNRDLATALAQISRPQESIATPPRTAATFCACRRDEAVAERTDAAVFTASLGLLKRDIFTGFERDTARCGRAPRLAGDK